METQPQWLPLEAALAAATPADAKKFTALTAFLL